MARKAVKPDMQADVLVNSRRRCCICYGLNRDTSIKSGQIAHLDKNRDNNARDNLAFICLDHHDEYDGVTRQRKNLTIDEVKSYRDELHQDIGKAFSVSVHFGDVTIPRSDPYAGTYIRVGSGADSAEIILTPVPDAIGGHPRYFASGFALWGTHRECGPNTGEMGVVGEMRGPDAIEFYDYNGTDTHIVRMTFNEAELVVDEDNWIGRYGLNVNFIGTYKRV